ncbi:MAG: hypothetical protein WC622_16675 [Pedobacter sp.]|jgi:hypothetical protein|uniref:hypothetical protein n=1 Tax=Pedobacter sp. TaxID=1411316 RepID=UPI0035677DA3
MKKEKVKSASKKAKKELVDKLIVAFTAIVADQGTAKKTKVIIEKFAKQLSKKIELKSNVEVIAEVPVPIEEKATKVKVAKKVKETAV